MSAGQHLAGLWEYSDRSIWAKSPWGARVRLAEVGYFASMNGIDSAANARRIVAAVNACDGITTERLEDLGRPLKKHLFGADERAHKQAVRNQELVDALIQGIEGAGFLVSGPTDLRAAEHGEPQWVCNARAAIARAAGSLA